MKKKHPGHLDPPLKVLSFYRNEEEPKDFGDWIYDLLNSDREDDKQIIESNKGMIISINEEDDMLHMKPFGMENQEINWIMDKIKMQLLVSIEI